MANEIFDQNGESNFKTLEINTEKKNTKSIRENYIKSSR